LRLSLALTIGVSLALAGFAFASSGPLSGSSAKGESMTHFPRVMRPNRLSLHRFGRVLAPNSTASNSATFPDPSGDSGSAPDVTTVTVASDDAGNIMFTIAFSNRPALQSQDVVVIGLDSDQNLATGGPGGLEYGLAAVGTFSGGVALLQWNGSTFQPVTTPASSLSGSYGVGAGGGLLTIRINRSDLGGTTGFNFAVGTSGDNGMTIGDLAPNSGTWSYQLGSAGTTTTTTTTTTSPAPALSLRVLTLLTTNPARAGKRFVATLVVIREDTVLPLTSGSISCSARAGSQPLRVKSKFFASVGPSCAWLLPKKSKGKTLRGVIAVTFKTAKARGSFARRIR
jgi:hypothetical protein